jgi:hypothetical protein
MIVPNTNNDEEEVTALPAPPTLFSGITRQDYEVGFFRLGECRSRIAMVGQCRFITCVATNRIWGQASRKSHSEGRPPQSLLLALIPEGIATQP